MSILDVTDYPTLRVLLNTDADSLSDAVLDVIVPLADSVIKRLVPGWASLTGDALLWLQAAALYLTAERIILAQPRGGTVSGLGFTLSKSAPSVTSLRDLAAIELAALGVELPTATGFVVHVGRSDGYTEFAAQ